jgi:hypothetical protein
VWLPRGWMHDPRDSPGTPAEIWGHLTFHCFCVCNWNFPFASESPESTLLGPEMERSTQKSLKHLWARHVRMYVPNLSFS